MKWSSLGLFGVGPDINGYVPTMPLIAGVTWTLQYEWGFYFALPLVALAGRTPRLRDVGIVVAILLCIVNLAFGAHAQLHSACAMMYLFGLLSAAIIRRDDRRLPDWLGSIIVIAGLAIVSALPVRSYHYSCILIIGPVFHIIASGCTVFGLLTNRGAVRLGEISYGTYLLHGLLLTSVLSIPQVRDVFTASTAGFWGVAMGVGVALVIIASVLHIWVERPGIAWGRRVGSRWAKRVAEWQSTKQRLLQPAIPLQE